MSDYMTADTTWNGVSVSAMQVLDLVPDFVGVANRDGRLVYINQSGRKMLGIPADDDLSRYFIHDFFPNWTIASLTSADEGDSLQRWVDWSMRGVLRARDGREISAPHAVFAHTDDNAEIASFTIIARGAFAPAGETSSLHKTAIDDLARKSVAMARAALPPAVTIEESLDCNEAAVLTDPTQIHQMVMNLCLNSAQSMREGGGRIFINTTRVAVSGPNEPGGTALRAGNYIRLTIRDDGPGLAPSVATHVFDPAVAGSGHGEATDYGLWNVKRSVVNSGGDIFVETAPGRGTAFHVYMPLMGANGNGSGP